MDESSDDDRPLGERKIVNASAKLLESESDDNSPIPEWISQNTPEKPAIDLADTDSSNEDLIDLATQPSPQKEQPKSKKPNGSAATGKPSAIAGALAKAAAVRTKAGAKLPSSASKLPPAGAVASQAALQVSAIPDAAPGAEVPVLMPEKLPGLRYLVELEETGEGGADLAGDAGAVGRFSLSGASGREQEMLLDLKGRIYSTSLVQCASTFCVVNLQANEAKVEAMLDSYVSLWEDERHAPGMDLKDIFMYDDDEADAYQVGDEDNKPTQKPGKRKAKDEGEDAPKAKRKQLGKPANVKKKPTAKSKAGGKGGAKGKKK